MIPSTLLFCTGFNEWLNVIDLTTVYCGIDPRTEGGSIDHNMSKWACHTSDWYLCISPTMHSTHLTFVRFFDQRCIFHTLAGHHSNCWDRWVEIDGNRQHCRLNICSYFGWIWQNQIQIQIWDEQACLYWNWREKIHSILFWFSSVLAFVSFKSREINYNCRSFQQHQRQAHKFQCQPFLTQYGQRDKTQRDQTNNAT